jgi:alanine dehydrogenase
MMSELSDIAKQAMMQPQEAMLELRNKKNNLYIGIPKETSFRKTESH